MQSVRTDGGVPARRLVEVQCIETDSCVPVPSGVRKKRVHSNSRIGATGSVVG